MVANIPRIVGIEFGMSKSYAQNHEKQKVDGKNSVFLTFYFKLVEKNKSRGANIFFFLIDDCVSPHISRL